MSNPFTMTFGMEPNNYIKRLSESEKIITDFMSDNPTNYVYLLTGIRGSGKTVLMYSIANKIKQYEDWIVANIGPKDDILEEVASEIYEQGKLKHLFLKNEFSVSFQGFGLSIKGKEPVSSVMTLLKKMLVYLEKKNKKILITIDEVDNSESMKSFIQGYAALLGQKLPMRLLMTGLYSNVSLLQNNKSLTFLYRTPKIQIGPLSIVAIAGKYSELLKIDMEKAMDLAKITKGYAYAYQVLGHIMYENNKNEIDSSTLNLFDQWMAEYVYEKDYSEISLVGQQILKIINEDKPVKISEIAKALDKDTKFVSAYRDQLIKEGVLFSPSYGYVQFALPRFDVFIHTK